MYGYPSGYKYGTNLGYKKGGGAAFLPSSVTGLLAWYRFNTGLFADTGKTTPAVTTVAVWADSSGNSRDMVQATGGQQPLLNGGAIDFDGADDNFATAGALTLKPATFFALANFDIVTGNQRVLGSAVAGGLSVDLNGTSLRLLKQDTALIGTSSATMSATAWTRIIVTYDGSGNFAFYVNGSAAGTGTLDQAISSADLQMAIGGGTSGPMNGKIKDFGVYDSVLSAGNITSLDTYLSGL